MPKELFRLEDIIDLEAFQKIQDDIARATEMAILTVDFKGVPFTGHSRCQDHCQSIRQVGHYRDLCQKCDSRGGIEAARSQKPYIYMCHRGLVDLAVPIMVRGQYVGAVMAGQIQLDPDGDMDSLETIVAQSPKWLAQATEVEQAFDGSLRQMQEKLPSMTLEKIEAIASMLSHICHLVIDNALLKWEADHQSQSQQQSSHLAKGGLPSSASRPLHTAKDDLIQPAIDYLKQHIGEEIYIDQMAKRCGVSVSYFSKCFNQSTGLNFASYVNLQRLERAKELLETDNVSVGVLSDHLGFDSSGYFIKQFKAKYGVTPAVYRQQYQAKQAIERS